MIVPRILETLQKAQFSHLLAGTFRLQHLDPRHKINFRRPGTKTVTSKKKTVVTFGTDEHIPIPHPMEMEDIWERVDTEEEDNDSSGISYKQYVIIDVGGERFQASRETFTKYPHTRLGKLTSSSNIEEILSLCEEFMPGNPPEYFFDRNPESFPAVLEMYRSGKFHIPDSGRGNHLNL